MDFINVILVIGGGAASFIGSYAAQHVHMQYLRRDVDLTTERLNEHLKSAH